MPYTGLATEAAAICNAHLQRQVDPELRAIMDDDRLVQLNLSDEVLVELVAQGNVNAFTILYDRYSSPIYAMAVYLLGHAEAEEIVQETFLRLWSKAEQFNPRIGPFQAWFMAIARHLIFSQLRRRSQHRQFAAGEQIDQVLASLSDPTANPEEDTWLREQGEQILHALGELPNEQRRVLILAYFSGLSHSTIAEQLRLPLGTVKKRIRLGLQKLRAAFAMPAPGSEADETEPDKDVTAHHDL